MLIVPAAPIATALFVLAIASILALIVKLAFVGLRLATQKTAFAYVPFSHDLGEEVLVTDCTHPHARYALCIPVLEYHTALPLARATCWFSCNTVQCRGPGILPLVLS